MTLKLSLIKSAKSLKQVAPFILGTIMLVSLMVTLIPESLYKTIFSQNIILDSFIGSALGSISVGTPIISYILGGELLKQGVSLIAMLSFLVAWVTVGLIQLPAESAILGKKFALFRNGTAFILAIIVAMTTAFLLQIIS